MIKFWYKCRLCGATFLVDSEVRDEKQATNMILYAATQDEEFYLMAGLSLSLFEIHSCCEESIGLADLIGFEKVLI